MHYKWKYKLLYDMAQTTKNCTLTVVLIEIHTLNYIYIYIYAHTHTHTYIQGVPGGKDLTSGECSLGQTIPI